MRTRWIVAAVGSLALAAIAVGYYMPWRDNDAPMPESARSGAVSCPADAKPANMNFTLKDVGGKDVTLSEFKNKVVVLNFWATWCGPCKIEIPHFIDFQRLYGSKGLQVIGVSIDDTVDQLVPFVSDMRMNYVVLQGLGHDDMQDAFGPIYGIPVTVVISRDGRMCAIHNGLTSRETF